MGKSWRCSVRELFSILIMIHLLTACSSQLSFSELSEDEVNNDIQTFIDNVKNKNGVYLYFENDKSVFVYLNGSNVKQGEKAIHFKDFNVEGHDDTLSILYNTAETEDYSNQSVNHELLYKVKLDKEYEFLIPISNGEEVEFSEISGNQ